MMSDLRNEEVIHDDNFTNTYSLWGNSKYYDIKNLSPQNFSNRNGTIGCEISQEFKASRWAPSPSEVQVPEPPDSRNRRTVQRDSLYEDPDLFYKEVSEESPNVSPTFDWTQFYWHKATEMVQDGEGQGPSRSRKPVAGASKIQKKLDKMLARPVKMAKAETMMQKMGWQGGALGRSGDGIVEPIAPNAVYAKKKIGVGQNHIQVLKPPKNKKSDSKAFFEMNALLHIYEFVKNNSEVELLFDKKLRKDERKRIHHLVGFQLKADDLASVDFDSIAQMDLVLQISDKNCYVLNTLSTGAHPFRQLCIYKEAPPHVYLIIPDDLRGDEEEEKTAENGEESPENREEILKVEITQEETQITMEKEELEIEEETNPFLISITRNLKKRKSDSESEVEIPEIPVIQEDNKEPICPEMSKITAKIVEFFTEFAEDKTYSQFKFLGPFNEEEIGSINEFIQEAAKYLTKEDECRLARTFEKVAFEINEDCTGNTVIYKKPV